ncbi:DNA polymerase V [Pseudomonas sp. B10]|nr:DNA polymerase V [Pseudomonas sp. B10]
MTTREPVFALIDCNSFYESCERVFRPDLARTPIVVLSYSDLRDGSR